MLQTIPINQQYRRDAEVSMLWFDVEQEDAGNTPPSGRYWMRGGIAWPMQSILHGGDMFGFAVTVGYHIATKTAYVMDQREFACIDHIMNDAGSKIRHYGIAPWFVQQWARYYLDTYYWHQFAHVFKPYLLQIYNSEMIQPCPGFPELDMPLDQTPYHVIATWEASGKLVYPAQSVIHNAILAYNAAKPAEQKQFPAIHAMACAMWGVDTRKPLPGDQDK